MQVLGQHLEILSGAEPLSPKQKIISCHFTVISAPDTQLNYLSHDTLQHLLHNIEAAVIQWFRVEFPLQVFCALMPLTLFSYCMMQLVGCVLQLIRVPMTKHLITGSEWI